MSRKSLLLRERCREVEFLNLEVIHEYLKTFNYPSEEDCGRDAHTAPWMVIHHAPPGNDRDYCIKNMPFLLNAWETGNLKEKKFSFFLIECIVLDLENHLPLKEAGK